MRTDFERLFSPSSVAVVADFAGVSGRGARHIVANLDRVVGLTVWPVCAHSSTVDHPSATDSLGAAGKVDVVIVYLRASEVVSLVDEAAEGTGFMIVQSAGFAETGDDGRLLQDELTRRAHDRGIRVIGPNCTGVLNGRNGLSTATVPMPGTRAGGASLLVQSGVMAGAVLAQVMNLGTFGAAKVCSLGNKADVDETDLLAYLMEDDETLSIGMYLEWISRPDEFVATASRAVETKPVIALVGGSTEVGARLTRRHTARPDSAANTRELAERAGINCVSGFTEMLEVCNGLAVLSRFGTVGPNTAVVTLTGSGAVVAVDSWDQSALRLADLSLKTRRRLRELFPSWLAPENPLDIWPAASHNGLQHVVPEVLAALDEDPSVDQILAILPVLREEDRDLLVQLLPAGEVELSKPIVCWYLGGGSPGLADAVERRGTVVTSSLDSALTLLRSMAVEGGR